METKNRASQRVGNTEKDLSGKEQGGSPDQSGEAGGKTVGRSRGFAAARLVMVQESRELPGVGK